MLAPGGGTRRPERQRRIQLQLNQTLALSFWCGVIVPENRIQPRRKIIRRQAAGFSAGGRIGDGSGARPAADIDHVAISGGGILVDEAGDQNAAVEGNNLAILLAAGRSSRTDIILAARATLEPQLLRRRLVSQMHDHAARGAGADDIRLLALPTRRGFGAGTVIGVLERREPPAADNLVRANRCRLLGLHARLRSRRR